MIREKTTLANFTENELQYIMERRLCRIALVCADLQPHIVPVTYEFDGAYFYLSGWNIKYGSSFLDIDQHNRVTMLIDDLSSHNLWVPRGIEITGNAETMEREELPYLRIIPTAKTSWGL